MSHQPSITDKNLQRRYEELEVQLREKTAELEQMKHTLEQTQIEQEMLLAMFDGISDGLLLLRNDEICAVNQHLSTLIGSDIDSLRGKDWTMLKPPLYNSRVAKLVQQTRLDGGSYHCREQYTTSTGERHTFDIRTFLLKQQKQQGDWVLVQVVDVTERLQLEVMLLQSERLAASGKLSATVAHEVNSPLQTIQSAIYMAERANDTQRSHYLSVATSQIDRISMIIRRMIDLHQVGDGSFQWINLHQMIKRLIELLEPTLQERHIRVHTDLWRNLPTMWGHAEHLTQALLNSILNAIEAMDSGGTLSIRTTPMQPVGYTEDHQHEGGTGWIQIDITDTGCGMPPEVQARIFDPFFTTRPGGLGIGMTVCQKIITDHGGQMAIDSVPGVGTTITFWLPTTAHTSETAALS